jgi:hypothetical protein
MIITYCNCLPTECESVHFDKIERLLINVCTCMYFVCTLPDEIVVFVTTSG